MHTILEDKKTPLYEIHKALGARLVSFAGWQMPVLYSGVIEEHLAVRSSAGLFDVSHMGEIEISGKGAHRFVQRLITNDVDRVGDGQCLYALLCYPDGGVVDDVIVYRYNKDRFLFCVNASNVSKVHEWFISQAPGAGVLIEDRSGDYAQLAVQGPASAKVMERLMDVSASEIKTFHFMMVELDGIEALVSRTGYTGEDGFEIYVEPCEAEGLWRLLMDAGKDANIKPIGLGARDTLRLEMGYSLYGHELSEKITPLEAGLSKYVRQGKTGGFIGQEALLKQTAAGPSRSLIGFKMIDPGIPRQDYAIAINHEPIGVVTSGTMSPSLKCGIGLGLVASAFKDAVNVDLLIRGRAVKAGVVRPPFYKRPS